MSIRRQCRRHPEAPGLGLPMGRSEGATVRAFEGRLHGPRGDDGIGDEWAIPFEALQSGEAREDV